LMGGCMLSAWSMGFRHRELKREWPGSCRTYGA
jgi:hypothetical protein